MPTYQVTTDKGVYQVDTESQGNQQPNQQSIPQQTQSDGVSSALDAYSNSVTGNKPDKASVPQQSMGVGDQVMNDIAQFGKGAYNVTPFAKRINQLAGMINPAVANADEIYKQVGQPQGVLQQISSMAGQLAPQIAMAAPFMKASNAIMGVAQQAIKGSGTNFAANVIGGAVGSPMVRGAVGLGAYSGTKEKLMGGNGQEVTDATVGGITQGLIYGGLSKIGATFVPAKVFGKYAETIGSAVGGGVAGAITAPSDDTRTSSAIFMGALSALTPEERFDFHKTIANNVTPSQWENYLRKGLQISSDDTKVILDNGINEIERVGKMQETVPNATGSQDVITPVQISNKFYDSGIGIIKDKIGTQFKEAIESNKNIKPENINKFVSDLKKEVDNYSDSTSPIVRRFNTKFNALQGFEPTTTETEIAGNKNDISTPNPRKVNISNLPPNIQAQVREQLGQKGDINSFTLNSLHELKMNLNDAVSDKAWKTGEFDPNERFAHVLAKKIADYIGEKNDAYKQASKEYSIMRMVKSDIGDLNTSNLAKDWNSLQPAQRADMLNKINSIGSYFNRKGVGQYNPKGLLEKYHAWNAISNPDLTSFRNNAPLKVAFQISAAKMGAILGLPFGVSGSALGGGIGYLTALHYMRPESYIPILRELQPNLKSPESMNSDQALKLIKKLIASKN